MGHKRQENPPNRIEMYKVNKVNALILEGIMAVNYRS